MALKGAKSQLQQARTYGGVASSRIRPLTRLVGKFSKSKVSPKKKIRPGLANNDLTLGSAEVSSYRLPSDRNLALSR